MKRSGGKQGVRTAKKMRPGHNTLRYVACWVNRGGTRHLEENEATSVAMLRVATAVHTGEVSTTYNYAAVLVGRF